MASTSSVIDLARQLAALHGERPWPCPICAGPVHGKNMDRHLNEAHSDHDRRLADRSQEGRDHRVVRPLIVLALFGALATATSVTLFPHAGRLGAVPALAVALPLIAIGVCATRWSPLRARLELQGDELTLSYAAHTLRHGITLSGAVVETGSLVEPVPSPGMSSYQADTGLDYGSDEKRVGSYLRLLAGGRVLIIGCGSGTALRKHWRGSRPSGKRQYSDITVAPSVFVWLQYRLAERGLLKP